MASAQQIIGGVLGAIAGFLLTGGNPVGALKGFAIGYTIGTAFTSVELPPGPKVDNKAFTDSSYGAVIPQLYGTDVVPTNVIWMLNNEYQEVATETEVAKNQYQTQYNYFANFALSLGEGPFRRIVKVYANNVLIFNADSDFISSELSSGVTPFRARGFSPSEDGSDNVEGIGAGISISVPIKNNSFKPRITFYRGDYQQTPDPLIALNEGDNAPAFRGIGYIVFENFELSKKFFNTMPSFKVIAERVSFAIDVVEDPVVLDVQKLPFTSADGGATGTEVYLDMVNSLPNLKYDFDNKRTALDTLVPYHTGLMCVTAAYNNTLFSSWGNTSGGSIPSGPIFNKDIRFKYTGSTSATFPVTYETKAYGLIAMQHNKTPLVDLPGEGGAALVDKPIAPVAFAEEAWLYPFDIPTKNSAPFPWFEDTAVSFNTADNCHILIPVINTNDLFLVMWAESEKTTFYWGIAKLRNGRFRVNTLDGFNPINYDPIGVAGTRWTVHFGTNLSGTNSSNIQSAIDRLSVFYFNDNVYIHFNDYTPDSPWVPNMCATVVVPIGDRNFGYPTPFTRRDQLFDWSTFTSYNNGDYYAVDSDMYQFFSQRKFITDWYVAPYQYGRLIPDYENGSLYAHQTITFNSVATTAFPTLSSITTGHLYKLDPETLAPATDYGNLTTYVDANKPLSNTFTQHNNGLSQINGLYLARVIKDVLYIMTSYGVFKIEEGAISDHKFILENNYVVGLIEKLGTAGGTLRYNTIPDFNTYTQNLIPLSMTDDTTDVLVGTYIVSGAWTISSSEIAFPNYPSYFACFAEYCVVRFFHGPYTDSLQDDTLVTLDEVVEAQILKSDLLTSSDYDVSDLAGQSFNGMVVAEQSPAFNSIQALQQTYLFDIIEEDYKLKFIQRQNATTTRTIAATDLQASEVGEQPFEIKPTVPANFKAPSIYQANYRDIGMDYEVGTQNIEIPYGENSGLSNVAFPVALTAEEAYGLLESISRATEYAQRGIIDIQLTMKHSDLEVNQYIDIQTEAGDTFGGRIISIDKGKPGLVKVTILFDNLLNYGQSSFTFVEDNRAYVESKNRDIQPIVVDALPLQASQDSVGFWLGAYTPDNTIFVSAKIAVSYDEGETYNPVDTIPAVAQAAYCLSALPATGGQTYIDYTSTLTIKILGGSFATVTQAQLLGSEQVNTYLYGREGSWEIIKVLGWVDNGNDTYSSSGIIRGYKGTAHFMEGHEIGDKLYGLNVTLKRFNVPTEKLGLPIAFKFSSDSNFSGASTKIVETVVNFEGRLPLPVINVTGRRLANNDWYFTWVRQARVGIEWVNFSDVKQDEAIEQYNVYVINTSDNNKVVRTITVNDTQAATYTSAQQVTDWGSNRTTLSIAIVKVSPIVGLGVPAFAAF